jgi:hypothetical protein
MTRRPAHAPTAVPQPAHVDFRFADGLGPRTERADIAASVGLTLFVVLVIQVSDSLLGGKSSFETAMAGWLTFVRRPDILATITLTATVTVLFVYWQRDQERK